MTTVFLFESSAIAVGASIAPMSSNTANRRYYFESFHFSFDQSCGPVGFRRTGAMQMPASDPTRYTKAFRGPSGSGAAVMPSVATRRQHSGDSADSVSRTDQRASYDRMRSMGSARYGCRRTLEELAVAWRVFTSKECKSFTTPESPVASLAVIGSRRLKRSSRDFLPAESSVWLATSRVWSNRRVLVPAASP